MNLKYVSSLLCNEAGESVLTDKVRQAILKLNQDWRFCASTKGSSASCNDLNVNIKCVRRNRKRSTEDSVDLYDVSFSFPAEGDPVTNINTQEKSTIEKLLETLILEKDDFDVSDSLPRTLADPATLRISADFTCPVGQVVRDSDCVPCAPGMFFDKENTKCKPCPVGSFQDQPGQSQCKACEVIAGRQGTTFSSGARSKSECKESCPAGRYYNEGSQRCVNCGFGHYQPLGGSFTCRSCNAGLTTRTDQAISASECSEECPTGMQLTPSGNNATCDPCLKGFYRTKGREMACQSCPPGFTTLGERSAIVEDCIVPKCQPGSYLSKNNTCIMCSVGMYQPNAEREACVRCDPDTTTKVAGATHKDNCTNPCNQDDSKGTKGNVCPENARCLFQAVDNSHKCECKDGFLPVAANTSSGAFICKDRCDNYCQNDGVCKKYSPSGEPYCQCAGSYIGPQCDTQSNFAYIIGGSAGKPWHLYTFC